MSTLAIRQSGGASIISIPKAVLKSLKLHVGSPLDLSVKNNKIILTPVETLTLEEVLAGSPKKKLKLTKEDKMWLRTPTVGKEF